MNYIVIIYTKTYLVVYLYFNLSCSLLIPYTYTITYLVDYLATNDSTGMIQ